jgi:hypothetical protein
MSRGEMLIEAYCLDTDSMMPAEAAIDYRDDTYYCPEENCLIEVTPAKKKNAFFRALRDRLHDRNCKYFKQRTEGDGEGDADPHPSPPPIPLIPTLLGKRRRIPRLKKPDDAELLNLVRAAKFRPPVVAGTLEQIVTAWTKMTPAERSTAPLVIGNDSTTYANAFFFLRTPIADLDQFPWGKRIIYGAADLSRGRNGAAFLYSLKRFLWGEKSLQLSIKLDDVAAAGDKAYMTEELTYPSRATMFWFGPAPEPDQKERWLILVPPADARYEGLALRQHIHE